METQNAQNDLNVLRQLAESGRNAAPLGGRFLAWWGGLLSVAYTLHYLIVSGALGLAPNNLGWLWTGFAVVGVAGQSWMSARFPKDKPGAASVGNQVEMVVWNVAAMAILAYFVALVVKSLFTGVLDVGFERSLSLVFTGYGIALLTTGIIAQSAILRNAGVAAMVMVVVVTLAAGSVLSWLFAAAGAFVSAFLPGLLLLRSEPAAVGQ